MTMKRCSRAPVRFRPACFFRRFVFLAVLAGTVESRAEVVFGNDALDDYRISIGQALLPKISWKSNAPLPKNYRLRAKLIVANTYEFHLASAHHNHGAPLDYFPSGPGFVGAAARVETYVLEYPESDSECVTAGVQWSPTFHNGPVSIVLSKVALTSYELATANSESLPKIVTDEPMGSAVYKLRSKVMGVPGYPDGFHAALMFNNNGKQLEQAPPPGSYLNQNYWLKYSITPNGSELQTIGSFANSLMVVRQGTVELSSYFFHTSEPPAILTNEGMPAHYRLRAVFTSSDSGGVSGFVATTTGNNSGMLLDRLPPAGIYTVHLSWQKLDVAGNLVNDGQGPTFTRGQVTIYSGNAILALNASWFVTAQPNDDDEDGNPVPDSYDGKYFDFYVPTAGLLMVGTSGSTNTFGQLYGPTWNWIGGAGPDEGGTSPNFAMTFSVQAAGWYHLYVGGYSAGDYTVTSLLTPSSPAVAVPTSTVASAVTSDGFKANWTMAAGASSYELDVSESAYFNSFLPGFAQRGVGTGMSFPVSQLSPASTCFFRVRAKNNDGAISAWSAVAQTATAPSLPPYQSAASIDATHMTVSWGAVTNVQQYSVSYSTSSDFPVASTVTTLHIPSTTTATFGGLTPNTRYYYQVGCVGQFGAISRPAGSESIVTDPPGPVQLALQSWGPNDRPNIVVGVYSQVWLEESGGGWGYDLDIPEDYDWSSWEWEFSELTDPDGNYCGSVPSFFSVSWHENETTPAGWVDSWTDVTYPDGVSGSSWATTRGSFPKDDPVSGYNVGTKDRLYLLQNYRPGDAITFRAWNVVPDANCNTCVAKLYGPRVAGILPAPTYTSPTFAAGDRWQCTFVPSGPGVYQLDISYLNAAHTTPASGTVTYLIAVGPPVVAELTAPTGPVTIGSSVTFSVVATGNPTYLWKKGGAAIPGATSATLALTNVQAASAGTYTVEMTNADGTTSRSTTLALGNSDPADAPKITLHPVSTTVAVGQSATFLVMATGMEPITYQWKKGPTIVGSASSFTLSNVQPSNSGEYSVTVSNGAGTASGQPASLIVATASDAANDAKLRVYAPLSP